MVLQNKPYRLSHFKRGELCRSLDLFYKHILQCSGTVSVFFLGLLGLDPSIAKNYRKTLISTVL
jgi:hypothetical protein